MIEVRSFALLLFSFLILFPDSCTQRDMVSISRQEWQGSPHFKITTPAADYYYDVRGGGLSSLFDRDGNDWIGFEKDPFHDYPVSAAGWYRGIPNFVFGSENSGAGHPGFEKCDSSIEGTSMISTRSLDGKWHWEWTFHDSFAVVSMKQTDPDHPYWFLYEGPVGGTWDIPNTYWGTDEGIRGDIPDFYFNRSVFGNWRWVFFGTHTLDRVLFLVQAEPDDHTDIVGFLGNSPEGIGSDDGMVVFGFGRGPDTQPLMTDQNTFIVGFYENRVTDRQSFERLGEYIGKVLEKAGL